MGGGDSLFSCVIVFLSRSEEVPVRGRCNEETDGGPCQGVWQAVERTPGAPGNVELWTQQGDDLLGRSLARCNNSKWHSSQLTSGRQLRISSVVPPYFLIKEAVNLSFKLRPPVCFVETFKAQITRERLQILFTFRLSSISLTANRHFEPLWICGALHNTVWYFNWCYHFLSFQNLRDSGNKKED